MAHDSHTPSLINQDLEGRTREDYLAMSEFWDDPLGLPVTKTHEDRLVVREDLVPGGSKRRFGDLLMRHIQEDVICYIAPQTGMAGVALAHLAKQYHKRLILFAPATKVLGFHQLKAMELGAEFRFVRVAAMPVLKTYVSRWAVSYGAKFIPLGLKHELVTAAIVRTCQELSNAGVRPQEVWCAISTGVLSRGLQIGFPDAKHHVVAVARNLKDGERGNAVVWSHPRAFAAPEQLIYQPPFPSVPTYDSKAWAFCQRRGSPGSMFWNVACEPPPVSSELDTSTLVTAREWHDFSDVERGL